MNPENLRAMRADVMGDAADMAFGGNPVKVEYDFAKDELIAHIGPLETDRARLIVGARYLRSANVWRMPATRSQAAALSGIFGGRLDPDDSTRAHVRGMFARSAEQEVLRTHGLIAPENLAEHLYDYQADGVAFCLSAGSALLGDEMGTGKTIQAIEWMRQIDGNDTHLIVCPNSMKFKWASEIEKWWPAAMPVVIDGTAGKRRKQISSRTEATGPVVLIVNYEGLASHTKLMAWGGKAMSDKQREDKDLNDIEFMCVTLDEAHKIKDPSTIRARACKQMGAQAEHRLAMTGTPLLENVDDVWSIMNFVEPREYGSRNQWRNRYCRMQSGWHGGFENLGLREETRQEFDSYFMPRFIRRTKASVLHELPEKLPIDYRVLPMTGKQATAYKAMAEDFMVMVDGELLTSENPLSLTVRLRQMACGFPIIDETGNVAALDSPSNKLDAILDILEEAPGDPLIVYAESRKFIEMLEMKLNKKGYTTGMITGAVSAYQREQAVTKFQDGNLDLILGTLGAGAEGLTLTAANRIVLAQQSWAHGTNAQAIDRAHRIGQVHKVQPIVLISEGTIDHAVALTDVHKEMKLQDLVRDPEWMKAAALGQIR